MSRTPSAEFKDRCELIASLASRAGNQLDVADRLRFLRRAREEINVAIKKEEG